MTGEILEKVEPEDSGDCFIKVQTIWQGNNEWPVKLRMNYPETFHIYE